MTPVRILNMGSGFAYGDVITVPDTVLGASPGSGNVTFTLEHPTDSTITAANTTEITTPGGLFSGNPPGATLSSVSQLDVLNVANSLKMLTAVDGALVRIDLERSDLGATMSRMEHTISNLSNIVMNTKAARSRINDADIAAESTELSKAQVLNQAAQAMLAQANKAQQSILQLLN
jgi:flagellin